ncbi:hypothetical protein NQ318_012568 [Aromia moschata]|uniref:Reverse transcriptase domain-containing protein n=1 Tax=Aromia moschata TaxID=1265417 RepID=A0AAV8YIT0_9CUCU|nr:hypothetical protein NQ318_012568 [Aromia moschata]
MAHLKYGRTEKSCVAQHAFDNNHRIYINNLKLIRNVTNSRQLDAFESLEIIKCNNSMNKDNYPMSTSPLFVLINKDSYGSVNRGNKFGINSASVPVKVMYNGEYFQQHEGTAMGNSLSPFIANLFMSKFETSISLEFGSERCTESRDDIQIETILPRRNTPLYIHADSTSRIPALDSRTIGQSSRDLSRRFHFYNLACKQCGLKYELKQTIEKVWGLLVKILETKHITKKRRRIVAI